MNFNLASPTAIAPELPQLPNPAQEALQGIRAVLRDITFKTALDVRRLSEETVEQALQMGQWLWRMQRDLKRKEYRVFLSILGWAAVKARKYINLAKTFDGFEPSRLLGVELTTLLSLTSSRHSTIVAQLREVKNITQELVEQLIKENRPPRKSKKVPDVEPDSQNNVLQQRIDKDGSVYYSLKSVNLSESIGKELEIRLQTQTIGQVLASSLQLEQEFNQALEEASLRYQQELSEAVGEMRDRHIEMQRQLLERERRIAELEAQLAASVQQQPTSVPEDVPLEPVPESPPAPDILHSCTTWEQISTAVGRDRSRLLGIVKHWSASQRAMLPPLLAKYLEEKPEALEETLSWVSLNLFKAALLRLTFTVQGISGCRFVSLEYPQQDCEQWIFADGENRLIPLFGREGFAVECDRLTTHGCGQNQLVGCKES